MGLVCLPLACVDDPVDVNGTEDESETQMGTTSTSTATSSTTLPPPGTSSTTLPPDDSSSTTDLGSDSTSLSDSSSDDSTSTTGDTTSSTTLDTDSTTVSDTTVGDTTEGATESATSDTGVVFIIEPDGGAALECDVYEQDCADGEKCNPWADDGGGAWNAWRCFDLVDDPNQIGDACTVEGSGVSGIDDCDVGAMCWDVDPETNMGVCAELCGNSVDDPTCDTSDTSCIVANSGWLPLCLGTCDPILQDCDDGLGCYGVQGTFVCAPDASGDDGVYEDPCEYLNVCDPGLQCVASEFIPGCVASGCCTPTCEVSDPDCPDMLDCIAWFEEGEAPEGYEDVGFCGDGS